MRLQARDSSRPGLTLLEVLVAIFVMGIGLLALLVLFPLAALNMAQAIRDERTSEAAQQASNWADALGLRADTSLAPNNLGVGTSLPCLVDGIGISVYGLPATFSPLALPRVGALGANKLVGLVGPPATPWALTNADVIYHFSLLDDLSFTPTGVADNSTGFVARGGRYTWSYYLQQNGTGTPLPVEVYVLVYDGRSSTSALSASAELPLTPQVTAPVGTTSLVFSYAGSPPELKRGRWIVDLGPTPPPGSPAAPTGYFYRIVDFTDIGGAVAVDVETPLQDNISTTNVVVFLADVVEVFDRGSVKQQLK